MSTVWQVQEAKNHFSEVIDRALSEGPQTVTRHGKPVVRVVAVGGKSVDAGPGAGREPGHADRPATGFAGAEEGKRAGSSVVSRLIEVAPGAYVSNSVRRRATIAYPSHQACVQSHIMCVGPLG